VHTSHLELISDRPTGSSGHLAHPVLDDDGRPPLSTSDARHDGESPAEDAAAHEVAELRHEIEALRRRLLTLPAIEQAKGVLIGFYGIDADAAFALLVRWSQHTNIKLHLLASDLVAAAEASSGQPHAGLHSFLNQLPHSGHHLPAAEGLTVEAVSA
jgi:hypothetical protein